MTGAGALARLLADRDLWFILLALAALRGVVTLLTVGTSRITTAGADVRVARARTLRAQLDPIPGVEREELRRTVMAVAPTSARPDTQVAPDSITRVGVGGSAAVADSVSVSTAVVRTPVAVPPAQIDTLERVLAAALAAPASQRDVIPPRQGRR